MSCDGLQFACELLLLSLVSIYNKTSVSNESLSRIRGSNTNNILIEYFKTNMNSKVLTLLNSIDGACDKEKVTGDASSASMNDSTTK